MLHVVVSPSGALLDWNTDPAKLRVPPNAVVVQRPEWEAPPEVPYRWSAAHLNWVVMPAPPALAVRVPVAQYRARLTTAERAGLVAARADQTAPAWQREALLAAEDILTDEEAAGGVRPWTPLVASVVHRWFDVLTARGVVPVGLRGARVAALTQ